jgi:Cd2+/Zn2+-exporting ATPase
MSSNEQEQMILEGLDCASCSAKIEDRLRKLDGVNLASINFATKNLTIETQDSFDREQVLERVRTAIGETEPDVRIQGKRGERVLYLEHLGCAECAAKIEQKVAKLPGVEQARLSFATKKLILNISDASDKRSIRNRVEKIARGIEPDIVVRDEQQQDDETSSLKPKILLFSAALVLFASGLLLSLPQQYRIIPFVLSFLIAGYPVLFRAARNIIRGQLFDENFLMSIATIGAFIIGDFAEGAAVMLFYQVGEFFQDLAVNRSRSSIASLMDIRPDHVNLRRDGELLRLSPQEAEVGEMMVIRPGERIPLDGIVTEGSSLVDASALTGESMPRDVTVGSEILSGSVNTRGVITARITRSYGESTVSRILDLVEHAAGRKAKTENFITKFARYYTPAVVTAAAMLALIPPLFIEGALFSTWVHRALIFLVVSCPCALVVSIPLGFFGGIGRASRQGILVKGSNFLEALNDVETVVFDKTGTLTLGTFSVNEVHPVEGFSREQLLYYAAAAEHFSTHPIAASIRKAYGQPVSEGSISKYEELSGYGVKVELEGTSLIAGNVKLMDSENIVPLSREYGGTAVHVAVDRRYAGAIVISDEIKPDSRQAVSELRALGVKNIYMLTGDSQAAAEQIEKQLGLDGVYAGLLPDDKVRIVEELSGRKGRLLFAGDGINDAPVLARSDIGVAMGGVGSDAAIEAADVVLMTDEPMKIVEAIRTAGDTRAIVWQNIIFALSVKAVVLLLGAAGLATMWAAVFADVGVALLAVMNALRILNVRH